MISAAGEASNRRPNSRNPGWRRLGRLPGGGAAQGGAQLAKVVSDARIRGGRRNLFRRRGRPAARCRRARNTVSMIGRVALETPAAKEAQ